MSNTLIDGLRRRLLVFRSLGPRRSVASGEHIVDKERHDPGRVEVWAQVFEPLKLRQRQSDLYLLVPLLSRRQGRQVRISLTTTRHRSPCTEPTPQEPTGRRPLATVEWPIGGSLVPFSGTYFGYRYREGRHDG